MKLRRVDPRALKKNPGNPRRIQPGEMSDATPAASIRAVGILQPPTASEKDGAIDTGLQEIDVLVKDSDEDDHMASVDLWRAIESLASENWTEEAIARTVMAAARSLTI